MPRRSSRHLDPNQQQVLLEAMEECRRECIHVLTTAPIRGPVYLRVEAVMDAIDDLAEELTGQRNHFHAPPHSAP